MASQPQADHHLLAIEEWFIDRGVPHLIHDYSATRDVFTRSAPFLSVVFVVEVFSATNLDWPWWANTLAILGGLTGLLGAWMIANRARGRRLLARPVDVAAPELTTFVLAPAALPLVFGGDGWIAAALVAANLVILAVTYVVTGYGLVPMTRWAGVHLISQLGSVVSLLARALPLVLLFGIVLIVNAEVWQMAADLRMSFLIAVVALFVALGVAFLTFRIPREIDGLQQWAGAEDLRARLAGTPAAALPVPTTRPAAPPLQRRHWGNLGLVLLFVQGLQVLLVSAMLGAFFIAFGMLAISPETAQLWIGAELDAVLSADVDGREVVLSAELLKVSAFLAAFSGLYFAVTAVTDDTFRREFLDDVVADLRQVLAVRAAYVVAITGRPADPPTSSGELTAPDV